MSNEILLIISLIVIYSMVVLSYYLFGKKGLVASMVLAIVCSNIEVLILVDAFGIEQTLGNIMFASTFLVTDIMSEIYGKAEAKKVVNIGIYSSLAFIVFSQLWLLYTPSANDFAFSHVETLFTNTPRIVLVSFLVLAITQKFDVWMYHKVWKITEKKQGNKKGLLWIRNNASTLISQALNSVLFTFGAFLFIHDFSVVVSIFISSYIIFVITSIADTPFVYLARKIRKK